MIAKSLLILAREGSVEINGYVCRNAGDIIQVVLTGKLLS